MTNNLSSKVIFSFFIVNIILIAKIIDNIVLIFVFRWHSTHITFSFSLVSLTCGSSYSCGKPLCFSLLSLFLRFSMAASTSQTLENVCASLTLTEEEDEGLIIGDEDVIGASEDYKYALIGRLLTDKPIKFNIMKDTLAAVWRPGRGLRATEVAPNLFMFQFFHEVDINRILEDSPWSFEQSLLVLKRMLPNISHFEIPLTSAEFWVQVHKLPVEFFTEKIAKAVGSSLGDFVRADKKNFDGAWKTFLRVRVLLDITKPLKRKMKIKKGSGDWLWVELKYERLPNFCFLCGIIGHTKRFCPKLFEGANEETERPYGSWLRATGRRSSAMTGNQWLVSESYRRVEPMPTCPSSVCPQEVEMTDSDHRTYVVYEEPQVRYSDFISKDISGANIAEGKVHASSIIVESNGLGSLGQHQQTPSFSTGPNEQEKKRQKLQNLGISGSSNITSEAGHFVESGPKNLQKAGTASQARLGQ